MSWLQLSIHVSLDQSDATENLLLALGAVSVTLQDAEDEPILEPGVGETPLWKNIQLRALFDSEIDPEALITAIFESLDAADRTTLAHSSEELRSKLSIEFLADKVWEREWLSHFKPIQCGKRLWIYPSLQDDELAKHDTAAHTQHNAIKLRLDPGLAFGTGTHETTLLCLQWLDTANCANTQVLDFGCGSGILGIAALLLGSKYVVFVDNDPQALAATQANLQKNNIDPNCYQLLHADDYSPQDQQTYDIVVANILAQPLIDLAPTLTSALKRDGYLTLSGLQSQQQEDVTSAYSGTVNFDNNATTNNWVRLSGQRVAR